MMLRLSVPANHLLAQVHYRKQHDFCNRKCSGWSSIYGKGAGSLPSNKCLSRRGWYFAAKVNGSAVETFGRVDSPLSGIQSGLRQFLFRLWKGNLEAPFNRKIVSNSQGDSEFYTTLTVSELAKVKKLLLIWWSLFVSAWRSIMAVTIKNSSSFSQYQFDSLGIAVNLYLTFT